MLRKRSIFAAAALLGIILTALFDLWTSLEAVRMIISRGSSLSDALFSPPTGIIRLVACGLILCGAALMLTRKKPEQKLAKKLGLWLLLPGIALYGVLFIALATQSYGSVLQHKEAVRLGIFVALLTIFTVFRAITPKSGAQPH